MLQHNKIFLIGPMGAGKTAIGRHLARMLELPFVDLDHALQDRTGVEIALIFELEGEAGFRRRESQLLDELSAGPPLVLATGGGAILDPDNRRRLRERGYVVYLEAQVEAQLARTGRSRHRPLLQTGDRRQRLEDIFRAREALYLETAHHRVRTDGQRVPRVARQIANHLLGE